MDKSNFIIWLCDKPIVVMKEKKGSEFIFQFYYSFTTFNDLGFSDEDMVDCIEKFILDKSERTVLSEEIKHWEIINLDN